MPSKEHLATHPILQRTILQRLQQDTGVAVHTVA
jgi:hypothetical protein